MHSTRRRVSRRAGLCTAAALWIGCVSVGNDFPVAPVQELEIGTTTRADVQRMFGDPWRVGIEDGQRTWTYAHYRWSLFGGAKTRDLKIRYDGRGVVRSYTFSSSDPEDSVAGAP